jgi:predicted nuclease with RNAse H fold
MGIQVAFLIMAWRLDKAVVRGEIDNRIKGTVTGKIWLVGVDAPIELQLEGNCWRDMAGCLFTFTNPEPQKPDDEHTNLNLHQGGLVGDMTASRKVRVLEIPVKDAYMMRKRGGTPPEHMGNCIYLEWYSDFNGRVVIESVDYQFGISEPSWLMSEEEEVEQRKANGEAIVKWMERLTGAVSAAQRREEIDAAEDKEWSLDDDAPMDEFEWEKFMKESDARTDKMMELYEKYDGVDPEERERLIAREMGWEHIEEYLDAKANGELPETSEWEIPDMDELPDPQPDPLKEGIDWVLDDMGHPVHPLYLKCFNLTSKFRDDCKQSGALDEKNENPLNDLIFSAHMVTAKLAGALNSIWMDHEDGGFIVACLKRSLKYFNEAMQHIQTVRNKQSISSDLLTAFHEGLCAVREEILRLMNQYRNQL